jgi:putative hydrolase of the HAD superfamily
VLGVPAERILFIDDRQENVDGARAVGMKAIVFHGEAALRQELLELNVL